MNNTKRLMVCYLVVLHAGFAVLLARIDYALPSSGEPQPTAAPAPRAEPLAVPFDVAQHPHYPTDTFVPRGATVFLGDSITMALPAYVLASQTVNFGLAGQRSDELLRSLDVYRSILRAKRVVVTIGTNDLMQGREAGIGERYDAILRKIPVPVVMSSVFPMGRVPKERVQAVVMAARQSCSKHPRCKFVDAFAALTHDGATRPRMLADGVHLTRDGYDRWIAALRPAFRPI